MIARVRRIGGQWLPLARWLSELRQGEMLVIPAVAPWLDSLLVAAPNHTVPSRIGVEAVHEAELSDEQRAWVRRGGAIFSPEPGRIVIGGRVSRGMDEYQQWFDDGDSVISWLLERRARALGVDPETLDRDERMTPKGNA